MDRLRLIVQTYESDTFNARALKVTQAEAQGIAGELSKDLCRVVEEGGSLSCDGVRLRSLLDEVRSRRNPFTQKQ